MSGQYDYRAYLEQSAKVNQRELSVAIETKDSDARYWEGRVHAFQDALKVYDLEVAHSSVEDSVDT